MPSLPATPFERALAASGLVSHQQMVELQSTAVIESRASLPEALVERGLLNAWQVDQLSHGRTKFSLGPYQIVDAIGRGGMGHVFKGRHAMLGRVEAIKVLPREKTRSEAVESFLREIRSQAQLDHPNIVRVSYADRDGETYYLVTEYVPGIDLRRLVRRAGALPIDVAALIVLDVCDALEYAHRRGMVHRDVKPGNVLVTPRGDVKVTDLGLAWRLEDHPEAGADSDRRIVGTCDYLAPEAVKRPTCIMPVSDVYALGCTLYYTLTGKVPYPGGNPRDKLRRLVREEPTDPLSLRPDLPKKMLALLSELMHKDHQERTPTAAAAAERLAAFVKPRTRQATAALVERYEGHAGRDADGADGGDESGSDDTVDEPLVERPAGGGPLGTDPLAPSQPEGGAEQATTPLAAADQETEPAYGDPPAVAPVGGKGMIDHLVRAIVIASLLAAAALALSALWRT